VNVHNLSRKERKKLVAYYKTYGITSLKKHVDVDLVVIIKNIEEEINGPIKGTLKRLVLKMPICVRLCNIYGFFTIKDPFKKDDEHQFLFCKTLAF